ncbi:hypothetical protein CCR75_000562 [Bremia lactucae]|uniref:Centrosomal protein of 70 kDa n=1 Tax=Bremia lactucae TaxID=4779 RepID=A0A976NZ34_BRELC|nr:hypothetical protein CCR75_000562 [Bremia lactucae]
MLQVVKYVCELLHVTDITLVPSSLEKLCRVVAAVPRMETFIRAVCTCVGYESKEDRRGQNVTRFKLKDVLLTLEQWQRAHEKRQELTRFKTLILAKLCQRTRKCTVLDTHDNCNHDLNAFSLTLSCAIQCVSELVEFEKRVLCDNTISTRILAEIKCQPEVWIHPILKHFAHLFQVSTIHEVLPKMNVIPHALLVFNQMVTNSQEIYVQVNETKTFVRTICNLLHLKENASFVECLHDLKERLKGNDCNEMETRDLDNGKGLNFVVEKRKGTTSNTDTLDIVGVRQVRQMSLLVRELKHELGAATIDEILPRIQHLMELCCRSIHSNDLEDANR